MDLKQDFRFRSVSGTVPQPPVVNPLGVLDILKGTWKGKGFNQIWRPNFATPQPGLPTPAPAVPPYPAPAPVQDHFLELNETIETLEFQEVPGDIPNRGLLQQDINLHALRYLQQVQDANVKGPDGNLAGIHVEPGFWITIPSTTNPNEPPSLARLANIPHGVSLVAQGKQLDNIPTAPPIDQHPIDITPFAIGNPQTLQPFPTEQTLATPSQFRTPQADIPNVTQEMVTNPATFLVSDLQQQNVIETITLVISTSTTGAANSPLAGTNFPGSGLSSIAFLFGGDPSGNSPNARAAQMDATFWIETIQNPNGSTFLQLQYQQIVLLNFKGLSWPHVSVATLRKQ